MSLVFPYMFPKCFSDVIHERFRIRINVLSASRKHMYSNFY